MPPAPTRAVRPVLPETAADPARPRRILVVHNRYQLRGGEDAVVEREVAALGRAGLEVEPLFVTNDTIRTRGDRLRVAFEAARAPGGIATVLEAVRGFRPDVVHLHNTFPLISPAVHPAIRATGTATVQTLHNFRVTCANALLMRDGAPCEDCLTGSPYNAVLHGCYRGSRSGTLAVARMIDVHRRAGTWTHHVDRFIALTGFAKAQFIRAGLPGARISIKPNGLAEPGTARDRPRQGLLFVGRLSDEKGVRILAAAARLTRASIRVIGEGPLAGEMAGIPNLTLLGARSRAEVADAMAAAAAVVVPSICYEGLPMVIAEAFAACTPVIASRIGAMADIVTPHVTGLHARAGDPADLARACDWLVDHPEDARLMGHHARAVYERDWPEEVTTAALVAIYAEAMASRIEGDLSHVS